MCMVAIVTTKHYNCNYINGIIKLYLVHFLLFVYDPTSFSLLVGVHDINVVKPLPIHFLPYNNPPIKQ